jgi:hypothetical protein
MTADRKKINKRKQGAKGDKREAEKSNKSRVDKQ